MALEREVMLTGMFKNFEELEESLTVEELLELVKGRSDEEYRGFRFAASLKGIDLDEEHRKEQGSSFDQIKARAEARLAGKSEEEMSLETMGISITKIEE